MTGPGAFRGRTARKNAKLRAEETKGHPAEETKGHPAEETKGNHLPQLVVPALVSLTVAILAASVTLIAAHYNASESREKESREKRAAIYADYLAAARGYVESHAAWEAACIRRGRARTQTEIDSAQKDLELVDRSNEAAGAEFAKQRDLVYVYGSDDAWAAHLAVQKGIRAMTSRHRETADGDYREAVGNASCPSWSLTGEDTARAAKRPALMDIRIGDQAFELVFCREASARPRQGCDQTPADESKHFPRYWWPWH